MKGSRSRAIRVSVIFSVILFSLAQIFTLNGEAAFFFTAVIEYLLPAILCIPLGFMAVNSPYRSGFVLCIAALCLPLLHEIFGLVYLSILMGAFWFYLFFGLEARRRHLAILLAAGCLAAGTIFLMSLSPGVASRMTISNGPPITAAFTEAGALLAPRLPMLLLAPFLAVCLAEILPKLPSLPLAGLLRRRPWGRWSLFSGLAVLAVASPMVIVTATLHKQGSVPSRLLDALFMVSFAAVVAMTWIFLPSLARWRPHLLRVSLSVAIVGFALLPRPAALLRDMPAAIQNKATFDRRSDLVEDFRGAAGRLIIIDDIRPIASLPFYFDITPDPMDYRNRHFAAFLGVGCVEHRPPRPGEAQTVLPSPLPCPAERD